MSLDLSWIKMEKKHFKEINRRKTMAQFRKKIVTVIYPCYEASGIETPKVEALKAETTGDLSAFGI